MRDFSLLVKPAGDACNLRCPYCFYRGRGGAAVSRRMSDGILDRMVESYRELPIPTHAIAFQGGEPLIMGEDFFRRAAEKGEGIDYSVQTNATLVTPSMAAFFAERDWLIGVSPHWDSPFQSDGDPGVRDGLSGYRRLVDAGVATNILQLVTKDNVREPERLYRHIRDDLGSNWHQYIECTSPSEYAVTGEEWGDFLCRLFDVWKADGDEHRVSVRLFDSIVSQLVNGHPTMCNFAQDCRNYLVVEANGDVYPCDFHVLPEYRLGNLLTDSWATLLASPVYTSFGLRKRGYPDCPRNHGALDVGWKRFFDHALPYLRSLTGKLTS